MLGCDSHNSCKCSRLAAQEAAEEALRSLYFPMRHVLPLSPLSLLRYINNILNIYSMPSSDRKMFFFCEGNQVTPLAVCPSQFPLCIISWNWDGDVFTLRHWNTAALKLKPNNRNTLTFIETWIFSFHRRVFNRQCKKGSAQRFQRPWPVHRKLINLDMCMMYGSWQSIRCRSSDTEVGWDDESSN